MTKAKTKKKRIKAKKPELVQIGLRWYAIKFKAHPKWNDKPVIAYCSPRKAEIVIDSTLGTGAQTYALWHELFHAIFFEQGYMSDFENEAKVEALGGMVARLFPMIAKQLYKYK